MAEERIHPFSFFGFALPANQADVSAGSAQGGRTKKRSRFWLERPPKRTPKREVATSDDSAPSKRACGVAAVERALLALRIRYDAYLVLLPRRQSKHARWRQHEMSCLAADCKVIDSIDAGGQPRSEQTRVTHFA